MSGSNVKPGYTRQEMMAIAAAREIKDGDIVFCGTGISMLAAMAAKHISAPESVIVFETGAIDPSLDEIPLAVSDSRIMHGSSMDSGVADAFALMQNQSIGQRVVGILGAAQIDRFGNLNSTVIGDYFKPRIRFPGSGGACDVASFAGRTIVFMRHERSRFVQKLDYFTSPGWIDGSRGREKEGLPPGGPVAVITDMAVMRFDEKTREMYLAGCYPGIAPEAVLENMGFGVDLARAERIPPPSAEEVRILREVCDPQGLILGGRLKTQF